MKAFLLLIIILFSFASIAQDIDRNSEYDNPDIDKLCEESEGATRRYLTKMYKAKHRELMKADSDMKAGTISEEVRERIFNEVASFWDHVLGSEERISTIEQACLDGTDKDILKLIYP